jgi:hypothetical protein
MEEEWAKSQEVQYPELTLLRDIEPFECEEIKAFDGELNPLAFNHVKTSKAFSVNKYSTILEDDEEDMSWLETQDESGSFAPEANSYMMARSSLAKRSEDGWNHNNRS